MDSNIEKLFEPSRPEGYNAPVTNGPNLRKIQSFFDSISKHIKDNNSLKIFFWMPTKPLFSPMYSKIITEPIDLFVISNKVVQGRYNSVNELETDFRKILQNTYRYYEAESSMYRMALKLEVFILQSLHFINQPELIFPDVGKSVKELLLEIFVQTFNPSEEKRIDYIESISRLCEYDWVDGVMRRVETLESIKLRLDKGQYTRLDDLQEDIFYVCQRARRFWELNCKFYWDSIKLQSNFIKARNKICLEGSILKSQALYFGQAELDFNLQNLEETSRVKNTGHVIGMKKDCLIHTNGEVFCIGDFIYINPLESESVNDCFIIEILNLTIDNRDQKMVHGYQYFKPQDINLYLGNTPLLSVNYPSLQFHSQELVKSEIILTTHLSKVVDRCVILSSSNYCQLMVENFENKDVYSCQYLYDFENQTFDKFDMLLSIPKYVMASRRDEPLHVELFYIFQLKVKKRQQQLKELLKQTKNSRKHFEENIEVFNREVDECEGTSFFQYKSSIGYLKLGDFVYIKECASTNKFILHISRIILKECNEISLTGTKYIIQESVLNQKSIINEAYSTKICVTYPLSYVVGKCWILNMVDYISMRPTEIPEEDVYLCEFFFDDKNHILSPIDIGDRKIQLPLRKVLQEEIYYFPALNQIMEIERNHEINGRKIEVIPHLLKIESCVSLQPHDTKSDPNKGLQISQCSPSSFEGQLQETKNTILGGGNSVVLLNEENGATSNTAEKQLTKHFQILNCKSEQKLLQRKLNVQTQKQLRKQPHFNEKAHPSIKINVQSLMQNKSQAEQIQNTLMQPAIHSQKVQLNFKDQLEFPLIQSQNKESRVMLPPLQNQHEEISEQTHPLLFPTLQAQFSYKNPRYDQQYKINQPKLPCQPELLNIKIETSKLVLEKKPEKQSMVQIPLAKLHEQIKSEHLPNEQKLLQIQQKQQLLKPVRYIHVNPLLELQPEQVRIKNEPLEFLLEGEKEQLHAQNELELPQKQQVDSPNKQESLQSQKQLNEVEYCIDEEVGVENFQNSLLTWLKNQKNLKQAVTSKVFKEKAFILCMDMRLRSTLTTLLTDFKAAFQEEITKGCLIRGRGRPPVQYKKKEMNTLHKMPIPKNMTKKPNCRLETKEDAAENRKFDHYRKALITWLKSQKNLKKDITTKIFKIHAFKLYRVIKLRSSFKKLFNKFIVLHRSEIKREQLFVGPGRPKRPNVKIREVIKHDHDAQNSDETNISDRRKGPGRPKRSNVKIREVINHDHDAQNSNETNVPDSRKDNIHCQPECTRLSFPNYQYDSEHEPIHRNRMKRRNIKQDNIPRQSVCIRPRLSFPDYQDDCEYQPMRKSRRKRRKTKHKTESVESDQEDDFWQKNLLRWLRWQKRLQKIVFWKDFKEKIITYFENQNESSPNVKQPDLLFLKRYQEEIINEQLIRIKKAHVISSENNDFIYGFQNVEEENRNELGDKTIRCLNKCGFFGSPSNNGLCSKCYKDSLNENQLSTSNSKLNSSLTSPVRCATSLSLLKQECIEYQPLPVHQSFSTVNDDSGYESKQSEKIKLKNTSDSEEEEKDDVKETVDVWQKKLLAWLNHQKKKRKVVLWKDFKEKASMFFNIWKIESRFSEQILIFMRKYNDIIINQELMVNAADEDVEHYVKHLLQFYDLPPDDLESYAAFKWLQPTLEHLRLIGDPDYIKSKDYDYDATWLNYGRREAESAFRSRLRFNLLAKEEFEQLAMATPLVQLTKL